MSTTQHPLTDETRDRLVSYISGGTIDCSSEEGRYDALTEDDARTLVESLWEPMMQAVQAAALTVALPADPRHDPRPWQDCTRADIREGDLVERRTKDLVIVGRAHHQDGGGDWWTKDDLLLTCGDLWPLRRIPAHTTEKGTPMTETAAPAAVEPLARTLLGVPEGYGAPHHDAGRIKADDFVLQVDRDGSIRGGLANHQDRDGDWWDEHCRRITWAAVRADRPDAVTVWPAPTPPAEEVELPGEPRRLTDVVLSGGEKIAEAAWTGAVLLYARHPLATSLMDAPADQIEQWTLDGTRARRDGERPNGEPRFVKTKEEA